MVGIVQPKADPWCCLHFTKYKFNVYRKKYIRSGRDSAVVGIVGKSKSLDFLKMLIFWSLVRNSVVLAVYLLFSVACLFTVHEHSLAAALARLPEQTQEEIFLYYFQHLTQKEIGEQSGWTRSTIGRHIQLALKRLKEEMEVLSHE